MNLYLEKRSCGTYYFRQTKIVDQKQVVKRVSLKTRDIKLARLLAIKIIAEIQMDKLNKFNVEYHSDGSIKSLSVIDANDMNIFKTHQLQHEADLELRRKAEHARELQRIEFEANIERKYAELEEAQRDKSGDAAKLALREELMAMPLTMSQLLEDYLNKIKVTEGVKGRYRRDIESFVKYSSSQGVKILSKVSRSLVFAYIDYLRETKKKEDQTIKRQLNVLSTFFNYQIQAGVINVVRESNPFSKHNLKDESESREPFTISELDAIFSSSLARNKQTRFILMLLLTTAARPNEICQLDGNDIVLETDSETGKQLYIIKFTIDAYAPDGVTRIDTLKSLKTKESKRNIYLHELLIQNDFIAYLETRRNKKLFDLTFIKQKNFATQFSEAFSAMLRNELQIPKKVLYCLRHTACNHLAKMQVTTLVRANLMGHAPVGETDATYTQRFSPQKLKELTEEHLYFHTVKSLHN